MCVVFFQVITQVPTLVSRIIYGHILFLCCRRLHIEKNFILFTKIGMLNSYLLNKLLFIIGTFNYYR